MNFKIAYAKQTGTGHLLLDLPCQDYTKGQVGNRCACIALADGAGTVYNSQLAAKEVIELLNEKFVNGFDEWYSIEIEAFKDLFIKECTYKVEEMFPTLSPACTALVFAINTDGRSICCHIGDGAIFGVTKDGTIKTISGPENGDEPNQTFFISGRDSHQHLRVVRDDNNNYATIILCSDGVSHMLWNQRSNQYAPAINRISEWIIKYTCEEVSRRLEIELNQSFRVYTQDDMSIAVMGITE